VSWLARRTLVLAAVAGLVPPAAAIAPLSLAPLFALAAILALAFEPKAMIRSLRALLPPALLLAALSLWATASALWSILPLHSLLEGLRLAAIAAGAIVLLAAARAVPEDERRFVRAAAALGLGLALAFLLTEAATGAALARLVLRRPHASVLGYDRAATVAALALWGPMIGTGRDRAPHWRAIERLALLLAAAATVYSLDSLGALVGLALGAAVYAAASFAPRVTAAAMAAGLVVAAVALPLAVPSFDTALAIHQEAPWIKWSVIHRLFIWRFTAGREAERPLLGWGMDATRELPGGKTEIATLYPASQIPPDAQLLPLHPHDAILQWEAELGAPGTALALAVLVLGLASAAAAPAWSRAGRAGALAWGATALVVALTDFGAWQAWWLGALALTLAPLSVAAAEIPRDSGDIRARDRP
jgi:O-antigen ligase